MCVRFTLKGETQSFRVSVVESLVSQSDDDVFRLFIVDVPLEGRDRVHTSANSVAQGTDLPFEILPAQRRRDPIKPDIYLACFMNGETR